MLIIGSIPAAADEGISQHPQKERERTGERDLGWYPRMKWFWQVILLSALLARFLRQVKRVILAK